MSETAISLDGVRMNVTQTAPGGVVDARTIFEFSQTGTIVEARYEGGEIAAGRLIGHFINGQLAFRYVQMTRSGSLDSGASMCDVECGVDGRLRLIEHFEWGSREGTGTNVFTELA